MRLLKVTAEYRAESEEEAKQMNEDFKEEARKQGYILNSFSPSIKSCDRVRFLIILLSRYSVSQ